MKALIVYVHPEPKSFNGALKDLAVATLTAAGHEVRVSDLHAMRFNPVAGPGDIVGERVDPDFFRLQVEQRRAWEEGRLSLDIAGEQQELRWCDLLILQYPMYWFGLPAILKGWVDRVMTTGFAYGAGMRNETGGLAGRRAMLSLTTGAPESRFMAGLLALDRTEPLFFHGNDEYDESGRLKPTVTARSTFQRNVAR